MKYISVAIDGPAGAGKSTMAKLVASRLGYSYVDTGAIYRTIGLFLQICGISPKDVDGITRLIDDAAIQIEYDSAGAQHMILNGQDVTEDLRTEEMGSYASQISALKVVRDVLLDLQRDLAATRNVVMDGRDIGTVVLPKADVKIFLTASPEVRAQRRLLELREKGNKKATLEHVLEDIRQRDLRDTTRAVAPLKQAPDAVVLDTSSLSPEESAAAILAIVEKRLAI
ncbi:MAG TPA: (d)CMP kinase [Candidatus Avoscillospira avicola]|uniref:Cytidylate kinase n=1 Tax=Candidatus Avoscillospira avicola TaxID=2840706 RepID=A0A9D1DI57_9FIRM|nr:(d)CMP kinase [Candidatus Avoscillospira avicola]